MSCPQKNRLISGTSGFGIKGDLTTEKTYVMRVDPCAAGIDAARSTAKWRWALFGAVLGLMPVIGIVLLGLSAFVLQRLTGKIDLSTPRRLAHYLQNPACYTRVYQQHVKRVRCLWVLYGWLIGVAIFNLL